MLDAGDAWFDTAAGPADGTVCGVFGRAAYLRFGSRLLALCGPDVASGPLHLRIDPLPVMAVGQPAALSGSRLHIGGRAVLWGPEHRWTPRPLAAAALRAAGKAAQPVDPERAAEIGLAAGVVAGALRLVAAGDLPGLARLVGGRGPGLTPAGDDLLAGVLVVHAMLHPAAAPARRRAAEAAATTDVAAAFLRWAAAGQCIRPVHDLLEAQATGRPGSAVAARSRLRAIGASSGAALLLGIDAALGNRPRTPVQRARNTA